MLYKRATYQAPYCLKAEISNERSSLKGELGNSFQKSTARSPIEILYSDDRGILRDSGEGDSSRRGVGKDNLRCYRY